MSDSLFGGAQPVIIDGVLRLLSGGSELPNLSRGQYMPTCLEEVWMNEAFKWYAAFQAGEEAQPTYHQLSVRNAELKTENDKLRGEVSKLKAFIEEHKND